MKAKYHDLILVFVFIGIAVSTIQLSSCKKDNSNGLPVLTTGQVSAITPISALCGFTVKSQGKEPTWYHGLCWSTKPDPTTADFKTFNAVQGTGDFSFEMYGLKPSTQYFVRAYAQNSAGIAYGNEVNFTTPELSLGQRLLEGVVFFIDSTGQHGLIAASNDQGKVSWYNGSYIKTDAVSFSNGFQNTGYIVSAQGNNSSYAAHICFLYLLSSIGGNFWFLPSKDQLNLMYSQKHIIPGIADLPYWSSTESDVNNAWGQDFSTGKQIVYDKALLYQVRAIRTF